MKRWLRDPSFQDVLRKAKADALADATTKLRVASSAMVRVLVAIAKNTRANTAARVSAARCVIEMGLDAHVIEELEVRILTLERQGNGNEKIRFT